MLSDLSVSSKIGPEVCSCAHLLLSALVRVCDSGVVQAWTASRTMGDFPTAGIRGVPGEGGRVEDHHEVLSECGKGARPT